MENIAFGKSQNKGKTKEEKRIEETKNQLINQVTRNKDTEAQGGDEAAEEMLLAFDLLNKYKKDKNFIQKDLKAQKKQSNLIIQSEEDQ